MVVILPERIFYPSVQVEDVSEIVERTLVNGEVIERLLYVDPVTQRAVARDHEVGFYARQQRIVFRLNGILDPISLEDYIARDGYAAAAKAMCEMTPEQVIDEVREAGLRGRGGAGFPTGLKWGFCRKSDDSPKYIICNADEGDPGAFMDRSLLEGTPHAILDGMIIAGYAIGASRGLIYVRAEYHWLSRYRTAGAGARVWAPRNQHPGDGLRFRHRDRLRRGGICLRRGDRADRIPRGQARDPAPEAAVPRGKRLQGEADQINNVETLANVPVIILKGKDYIESGTRAARAPRFSPWPGR